MPTGSPRRLRVPLDGRYGSFTLVTLPLSGPLTHAPRMPAVSPGRASTARDSDATRTQGGDSILCANTSEMLARRGLPSAVSLSETRKVLERRVESRISESKHAAREQRKATTRSGRLTPREIGPRSARRPWRRQRQDSEPPAASPRLRGSLLESRLLRSRAAALLAPLGHRRRRQWRRRGAPPPDPSLQVQ